MSLDKRIPSRRVDPDLVRRMDRVLSVAVNNGERRLAQIVRHALTEADRGNVSFLNALGLLKRVPVTIDEFIESKDFLGDVYTIWPTLRDDLRRINPDVLVGEAPVHEALLGGATGSGKTTVALVTNLYQLYCLSCFSSPALLFPGLSRVTPIVFMFQSVSSSITRRVIYQPFRRAFEAMPFTQRYIAYDKQVESMIKLEGGIEVLPAVAAVTAMVGQAIIGGVVDEINFMAVVERSKQVHGSDGHGGRYDQAEEIYTNLSRRRKSRFVAGAVSFGVLVISSSVRYRDDFMDRRLREVEEHRPVGIVPIRRKQYDVHPELSKTPAEQRFRFYLGTQSDPPRVLSDTEPDPPGGRVELVPKAYLGEFLRDPEGAMRDVIGVASMAISPFFPRRDRILAAFERAKQLGFENWADKPVADLSRKEFPEWLAERMPSGNAKKAPHAVHLDLSVSGDRVGIAVVRLLGFTAAREEATGVAETVPEFAVPALCALQPSPAFPVDFQELRAWIVQLVARFGVNLVQVTFDSFQSVESQQAMRRAGIVSGQISVDRTAEPYLHLRRCLDEQRIAIVSHDLLYEELSRLEWDERKQRVDHPPRGSKDLADALCGALWGLAQNREVRAGIQRLGEAGPARPSKPRPYGRPRRR